MPISAWRFSHNRVLLLILAAVAVQAVVQGIMSGRVSASESMIFSAMAFATAAAVFGVIDKLRPSEAGPAPRGARVSMIWMNVATATTFLSFYVSISLVPASTTSSIESALGPVALMVIARVVAGRRNWHGRIELILVAVMVGFGLLLAYRTWQLSASSTGSVRTIAGLLLAAVAGNGMAVVVLLSKALGDSGISPVWVTAHRFHLTYVLAAVAWLFGGTPMPDAGELTTLFVFGVLAVVVSLFVLQVGVQRAEPLAAIAIIALLPGLTWLTQVADGQPPDLVSLGLIVGVVLASVAFTAQTASRSVVVPGVRDL